MYKYITAHRKQNSQNDKVLVCVKMMSICIILLITFCFIMAITVIYLCKIVLEYILRKH